MDNPRLIPYSVIDLSFGDSGKGTTVDWLCSPASPLSHDGISMVVRSNGGCQAGHNVHTSDGRSHTFSMWGSGTFHGVPTYLSDYVYVNPMNIINEGLHLESLGVRGAADLLWIDENCPVITPYHRAANQLREKARGEGAHGTCGHGFGEAVFAHRYRGGDHVLRAGELRDPIVVSDKLRVMRGRLYDEFGLGADRFIPSLPAIRSYYLDFATNFKPRIVPAEQVLRPALLNDRCVFEGAQGMLLDEYHGFHPHTTWSDCSTFRIGSLMNTLGVRHQVLNLGVVRAYMTRHGQGPFPTYSKTMTDDLREPDNRSTGVFQGVFRKGYFDRPLLSYATQCAGHVHGLVVTHMDQVGKYEPKMCVDYRWRRTPSTPLEGKLLETEELQVEHQTRLTETVVSAIPEYETILSPHDPTAYAEAIGVDLFASSYGPTFEEKRLATGWAPMPDSS